MDAKKLREYRKLRFRILFKGQFRLQGSALYRELDEEFGRFLAGIEDPVGRKIVQLYYRDLRSVIWIADKLHYSESRIRGIKRECIDVSCRRGE